MENFYSVRNVFKKHIVFVIAFFTYVQVHAQVLDPVFVRGCVGGTVTLTAPSTAYGAVTWYSSQYDGYQVASGQSYTLTNLSQAGAVVWIQYQNITARVQATVVADAPPGSDMNLSSLGCLSQNITVSAKDNLWSSTLLACNGSYDAFATGRVPTTAVDNITMEAFVYWLGGSQEQHIMYNGISASSGYGICILNNSLTILLGGVAYVTTNITLPTKTWVNIAAVRNSGVWTIYYNGVAHTPTSNATATPNTPTGGFYIGNNNQSNYFNGLIDATSIWTTALPAYEINESSSGAGSAQTGLAGSWGFNETDGGTTAVDGSGNGFNLTLSSASARGYFDAGYVWNMAGASVTGYTPSYAFTSTGTKSVSLTVTDLYGCTGSTSTGTISINSYTPPAVTVSASADSVCAGSPVTLTAAGGGMIFNEGFDGNPPTGWTATTGYNQFQHLDANDIEGPPDGSAAYYLFSLGGVANPYLQSPAFSTVGMSNMQLAINQLTGNAGNYAIAQLSTDATNWTTIGTMPSNTGVDTAQTDYYTIPANFANQKTVYLKLLFQFSLAPANVVYYYWEINNVSIITNPIVSTFMWTSTSGFTATGPQVTASPTTTTTYSVVANTGCSSAPATVKVVAKALPTAAMTLQGNPSLCLNSTPPTNVAFTGANSPAYYVFNYSLNGTNYQTTSGAGGSAVGVSVPTNVAGTFVYQLQSVSSDGCSQNQSGSDTVKINPLPTATVSAPSAACVGDTGIHYTLTGSAGTAPYNYGFTTAGGLSAILTGNADGSPNLVNLSTANAGSFTYKLTSVTDANGCTTPLSATATVVINAHPTVTLTPSTTIFCGDTLTLTAAGATSYVWSPSTVIGSKTATSVKAVPTARTTYKVTGTTNGCSTTAGVSIPYGQYGVTTSASSQTICAGSSINLNASAVNVNYTALKETFDNTLTGWQFTNTGNASAAWALQPAQFTLNGTTYKTADSSGFYGSGNFASLTTNTVATTSTMTSPAFSTVGVTNMVVALNHSYNLNGSVAKVMFSTDKTNWVQEAVYYQSDATNGGSFITSTIIVPTQFENQPTVYVQFVFTYNSGYWWAVNDIEITGWKVASSYTWASVPTGFASTSQNPQGVTPDTTTSYQVTAGGDGCTNAGKLYPITVFGVPVVAIGTIAPVPTNGANALIPYTVNSGSPNLYSITPGSTGAMPGFTATAETAYPQTNTISLPIPAAPTGTYNFNLVTRNSATNCGTATIPFTITVVSSDNTLSNLTVTNTVIAPVFNSSVTNYSGTVNAGVGTVNVTPTASNSNATITVDGIAVASGSAIPVPVATGTNYITIAVTSQFGTVQTYTVTVTRSASVTLYVDAANGSDANSGSTSFGNAFKTLSYALQAAAANPDVTAILIAAGTYYPSGTAAATASNSDTSFAILRNSIRLYGGYNAATGVRNAAVNKTYLDGNNSSYHIMVIAGIGTGDSVIVDGVILRNSNANSGSTHTYNGIVFNNNEGGAVAARGNSGLGNELLFRNCIFTNNTSDNDAGAFYNAETSPNFVNCLFANNTANSSGGAMFNFDASNPVFTNCTIAYNVSAKGAAINSVTNCTPVLNNSIVWLNGTAAGSNNSGITSDATTVATGSNSIIQGGVGSNSTADPLFVNAATGNFQLSATSPAVNTGSNNLYVGNINSDADLDGNARLTDGTIDMGAYEASSLSTVYVDAANGSDANQGTSWATALKTLSTAIKLTNVNHTTDSILVAAGTYYPAGTAAATASNSDTSFAILRNGVRIYGGYNASTGVRNPAVNKTYLDGNSSSYHIMVIAGIGTGDSVIVDGVTLRNANANSGSTHTYNGIIFNSNEGGAVAARGNSGLGNELLFRNCIFTNNTSDNDAGAFYDAETSPSFVNCLFANNTANSSGGAMFNFDASNPVFTNSTIAYNVSAKGAAINSVTNSTPVLNNSIVWLNGTAAGSNNSGITSDATTVATGSNSIIQGGVGSNSTADPLFVNAVGGDYSLSWNSPAIDAGSNNLYIGNINTDVDLSGNTRLVGKAIDMGAYENAGPIQWTGSVSTAWNTAGNWSTGTVPSAGDSVVIPSTGVTYQPTISTSASVGGITIQPSSILTISSTGNLAITGGLVNKGTFSASAGTINFNGTAAQTITGAIAVNNLTVNNTAGVTINSGTVKVYGIYTPQAGVLTTNGNLVLSSTANGTASVAQSTVSNYVTGNVTVERYISAHRAWRLLTAPLSNTGTIFKNWQNNGAVDDSTGANIWAPGGTGPAGNGLTAGGDEPSIESYDAVADNWVGLTNTTSTLLSGNSASAANTGIGLFVTGPYGSNNIVPSTGATATTLRATGSLQTGTQQFVNSGLAAGTFILVGNPYASPINFTNIGATGAASGNIYNTMWAWDAQRGGTSYGGYVTFSWDAASGSYDQDIDASQTAQTMTVQSGEGFFVQAVNNGSATVTINETDKASAAAITGGVFGIQAPTTTAQQLRITLSRGTQLVDGALAKFGDMYTAGVADDVDKLFDYDENLSLRIDTNYLAIERRPVPTAADTIFLDVYAMKKSTAYSFTVSPQNMPTGLQAWLVDAYTGTKTPLGMANSTAVGFNTGTDAGSLSETRFMIVFQTNGVLATATTLKAVAAGKDVRLEWVTPNELGVKEYQLQRSADGQNFNTISTAVALNSSNQQTYNYTDATPNAGDNYYRVETFNSDGTVTYSNVLLVKMAKGTPSFSVYPNPTAHNSQLHVQFANMAAGKYSLVLFSTSGKQLMDQTVTLDGITTVQAITLPQGIAGGSYRLVLLDGKGGEWKAQLVVQ